jgi:hypothetical protein
MIVLSVNSNVFNNVNDWYQFKHLKSALVAVCGQWKADSNWFTAITQLQELSIYWR